MSDLDLEALWNEAVKDNPNIVPSQIRQLIGRAREAERLRAVIADATSPEGIAVGAKVTVVGDSAGWSHEFPPGTGATVIEVEPAVDGQSRGYVLLDANGNEWSVAEIDIRTGRECPACDGSGIAALNLEGTGE